MSDLEQTRNLLAVAKRDYRALCGMEDAAVFSNEIFGFHVQQAVEKALKAWLSYLGVSYPKRHDLDELAALLEDAGQPIPAFACGLLEFTDFAVTFRYDAFPDMEADIDRSDCVSQVARLLQHVHQVVIHTQTDP